MKKLNLKGVTSEAVAGGLILIVALALAGGVYLFLTISKKKSKEQTEENAVEMMTANEMISTIGKAYESGITLYLNDEDTEVRAEILPDVGECIQDVYIYDVYDAEKRKVVKDKPNYTYNCSAVQLAYIIDTDVFAEEYGFDFPTIVTTTGTEIKHDDGVLTLMIEYSCLDRLETISEQEIGLSLYDVYDKDEKIVIGYAHSGKHSKEKDEGLSATGWSHTFGSEIITHLCVKTTFVDGEVTPPKLDNPHIYDGLSVRFVGAKVNPLLWFKAYRTDVNKDLLDSISAIQVIK